MGEAEEAGTAACTAVQQPHTEPTLIPEHRKWIAAAFLQASAALVSKSSGLVMLLLPGSAVLGGALRHYPRAPGAAPAAPWVLLCRRSPGTVLWSQRCGVSEDSAGTDPGSFSSAAAVHRPSSLHPAVPLCGQKGSCTGGGSGCAGEGSL